MPRRSNILNLLFVRRGRSLASFLRLEEPVMRASPKNPSGSIVCLSCLFFPRLPIVSSYPLLFHSSQKRLHDNPLPVKYVRSQLHRRPPERISYTPRHPLSIHPAHDSRRPDGDPFYTIWKKKIPPLRAPPICDRKLSLCEDGVVKENGRSMKQLSFRFGARIAMVLPSCRPIR
jgi:hypothetical protein